MMPVSLLLNDRNMETPYKTNENRQTVHHLYVDSINKELIKGYAERSTIWLTCRQGKDEWVHIKSKYELYVAWPIPLCFGHLFAFWSYKSRKTCNCKWTTHTQLKIRGELVCSKEKAVPAPLVTPVVLLVTNTVISQEWGK